MGKQVKKSKAEIATIDCDLITIELKDGSEFGFDTSNKIEVEPQIETTDAVKLVVKNILRAQKPEESVITGNKITLTDNVFNPELVLILQGGEIIYNPEDPDEIVGYNPPVSGVKERGEVFKLNAYTAQYDASGEVIKYEKISYPNCNGVPVSFGSEDGAFRAPEYTINSAPKSNESPYNITYVKSLPMLVDEYSLGQLTITLKASSETGKVTATVMPEKEVYSNKYMMSVDADEPTLPKYGDVVPSNYALWDGESEINAANGQYVSILECTSDGKVLSGGVAVSNALSA